MILMKRTGLSARGVVPRLLGQSGQGARAASGPVVGGRWEVERKREQGLRRGELRRLVQTSAARRDLEAGLRALGAGMAATGVIGSGIGLGHIFGNLLTSMARNPSMSNKIFTNAVMGAAFCESLGLFAIAVAFVVMG